MKIASKSALVTGAGSGLGAECARELARRGAAVVLLDRNEAGVAAVAAEIVAGGGRAIAAAGDITATDSVQAAIARAESAHGPLRIVLNVAGVGGAKRLIGRDGEPMPLEDFRRTIDINLVGSFNVIRLVAAAMARHEPLTDEADTPERGVIVNTASVAAYDGQIGQAAYAASKGGLVALTLPLARDLAQHGVRVVTIAPGLFLTPLMAELPQPVQEALGASVPFPKRLGKPTEFAALAAAIVENAALNGEVIRLDGALRMAPR